MQNITPTKGHAKLEQTLIEFLEGSSGMIMASLATVDGFNIVTKESGQNTLEPDMLSAISSSLFALSQASAKQISGEAPDITSVETRSGTILFISTRYSNQPCVLTVYAQSKITLGALRYTAMKLSRNIEKIGEGHPFDYLLEG